MIFVFLPVRIGIKAIGATIISIGLSPLVTVKMGFQTDEVESTELMECWGRPLELEGMAK